MKKYSVSSKYTRLFALLLGIGIVCIAVFVYINGRTSCGKLQCITFPLLQQSTNTEVYESTDRSYIALYTLPNIHVRAQQVSAISSPDADTLTKITVMRMQGQFETARSPYPGMLSDAITCDSKFNIQPITTSNSGQSILYFSGFLNNRMQYGSCIDEEIAYKGLNAILYCEKHQSWYRIEVLVPNNADTDTSAYTQQLQHISCQ